MILQGLRPDPEAMYSRLVADYLNGKEELRDFFHYQPSLAGITEKLRERKFSLSSRSRLVAALRRQYGTLIKSGDETDQQIASLLEDETYTVTTGHQLGLLGSPAFFHYKIFHTIALATELRRQFPGRHIVPVFWMASEDHDFEEISKLNLDDKTYEWKKPAAGDIPVGRLSLDGIEELLKQIENDFPFQTSLHKAIMVYRQALKGSSDLSSFTRKAVHELYKSFGLLVLDGDDPELKQALLPVIENDISSDLHFRLLKETSEKLGANYSVQAMPRRVNFFHLTGGLRERIKEESISLHSGVKDPYSYSPNVFFRPLYQELILPNLAYVGGPGEIAYWLQLRNLFEHYKIELPVLIVRNSVFFSRQFLWEKFNDFPQTILFNLLLKDQNTWWDWLFLHFEKQRPQIDAIRVLTSEMQDFENNIEKLDPTLLEKWKAISHKQRQEQEAFQKRINQRLRERNWEKFNDLLKMAQILHPGGVPQERIFSFLNFMFRSGKPVMADIIAEMKGDLFHPQVINILE